MERKFVDGIVQNVCRIRHSRVSTSSISEKVDNARKKEIIERKQECTSLVAQ